MNNIPGVKYGTAPEDQLFPNNEELGRIPADGEHEETNGPDISVHQFSTDKVCNDWSSFAISRL